MRLRLFAMRTPWLCLAIASFSDARILLQLPQARGSHIL